VGIRVLTKRGDLGSSYWYGQDGHSEDERQKVKKGIKGRGRWDRAGPVVVTIEKTPKKKTDSKGKLLTQRDVGREQKSKISRHHLCSGGMARGSIKTIVAE